VVTTLYAGDVPSFVRVILYSTTSEVDIFKSGDVVKLPSGISRCSFNALI